MKMIVRMFCAVALVAGALSLTGCGDEAKPTDAKGTNAVAAAAKDAKEAVKDAAKEAKDATKGAADAVKDAVKK